MKLLHDLKTDRRWMFVIPAIFVVVTTVLAVIRFLTARESPDFPIGSVGDYQHYHYAAAAILREENPYQQHTRFYGYLPLWALLQTPLVPLGPAWAGAVYAILNGCVVFAGLFLWTKEAVRRVAAAVYEQQAVIDSTARSLHGPVMLLTTFVMADKIRAVIRLGQTDAVILLAFFLAFKYLDRRTWLSGLALGFIAQFKFQSLAMVPYFIVRRMWRQLAWTMAWTVGLACSGSLLWGWKRNSEYLSIPLGSIMELMGVRHEIVDGPALYPLAWERSVSVPSVMARATQGLSEGENAWAVMFTGLILVAGIAWAAFEYRRHGLRLFQPRAVLLVDPNRSGLIEMVEWCGLIVGALAFSPQTTTRHHFLSIVLVAFGAALMFVCYRSMLRRKALLLGALIVAYAGCMMATPTQSIGSSTWFLLALFFVVLSVVLSLTDGFGVRTSGMRNPAFSKSD